MDKQVYIVHGSAIVQSGLADILRKNFKCKITCYPDLASLSVNEEACSFKSIIFVEDVIANSNDYFDFINKSTDLKSFSITNCHSEKTPGNSEYTLYLYHSADDICEQVKHVFKQQVHGEDEAEGLSNREVEVLRLVALGYANKEIADNLHISTHTVMSHRKNITEKLGIKSISGLTVYAIINNYIDTTNLDVKDLI